MAGYTDLVSKFGQNYVQPVRILNLGSFYKVAKFRIRTLGTLANLPVHGKFESVTWNKKNR